MKSEANPANSMTELPVKTREFLARLSPDDLDTLEDGVKLLSAARRLGRFARWMILLIVGTFIGTVMLWENIMKVLSWMKPT